MHVRHIRGKTTVAGSGVGRGHRRAVTFGATVGALALLLAACGGGSAKTTSPGTSSGGSGGTSASGGSSGATITGLYGALPPGGGAPKSGGTITIGQQKTSTPTYINPILPSAQSSVYTEYDFINLMNQPIYWGPKGATPQIDQALSIANQPTYSNGNKTVTLTLKGWKWSNGTIITAKDVVFYIDVLKAAVKANAANFGNYTPGFFPDNVATATASGETLTLNLTKAYNPGYYTQDQLNLVYAFPQSWAKSSATGPTLDYTNPTNALAIYNFLNKQASSLGTFASNPLWQTVDGPMKLTSFNATNGDYTMVPNPNYSGPQKARYSTLSVVTYTDFQSEFNALLTGSLDIGQVDYSVLPQVNTLKAKGYSVFGLPSFGWYGMIPNFADTTGSWSSIISQLYVRQALAHLVDQPGYVKGIFKNAGGVGYGPVGAIPKSPYTPANAVNTPYPYSVSSASKLLASHGWKVSPNGTTTCAKAGSASNECGAGIPAGTPFSFNLQYGDQPVAIGQQVLSFASSAKQVGINVTLQKKTFNFLIQNDSDPSAPSKKNTWAMVDFGGFTNSTYPTSNNLFNTGGSFNLGNYNSPTANKLINASVFGANPTAVKSEASYLTQNIPVLFQPEPDLIWGVKSTIGGTNDAFSNLTQYTWTPQYWYIK